MKKNHLMINRNELSGSQSSIILRFAAELYHWQGSSHEAGVEQCGAQGGVERREVGLGAEEGKDGGSASRHGGIEGSVGIEGCFERSYAGVRGEHTGLKVVDNGFTPR